MKYQFKSNVIVEGSSESDALNQIGAYLCRCGREISEEGSSLEQTVYTLEEAAEGEAVDLSPKVPVEEEVEEVVGEEVETEIEGE